MKTIIVLVLLSSFGFSVLAKTEASDKVDDAELKRLGQQITTVDGIERIQAYLRAKGIQVALKDLQKLKAEAFKMAHSNDSSCSKPPVKVTPPGPANDALGALFRGMCAVSSTTPGYTPKDGGYAPTSK